ncbi:MAG: YhiN family flavoprotein [Parcubacteria group bacterium Athens1014_10]|nr:MAG: YhiN family flavoprotein [Parcubacteria group bacterium Athens1014_10]TSD04695.1 MAG: YhiN family flavoprotein [Parcubacteria group bacterium Athens0714_12]
MKINNQKFDVAVVGGGPAGMMAAIAAAEKGLKTVLIEKNKELGKKLLITGKGRCNITNAGDDIKVFIDLFGKNGKFLFSAINNFNNNDVVNFFNQQGLKTKIERGNRVFPVSDNSSEVLSVLINQLKKYSVTVLKNIPAKELVVNKNRIEKIKLSKGEISANKYIICTGGLAHPQTGSTGDGFEWAKKLGHKIIAPRPSLSPILVKEKWVKELEGLSLKNVLISAYQNNKKKNQRMGEALFTSNGMSGPIILDMSKNIEILLGAGKVELKIDFKPALDYKTLDKRIQRDFEKNKNKIFKNSLNELLPKKLIPVVIKLSGIDENKKSAEIKKEERKRLVGLLKDFKLEVRGIENFSKAIITAGGINLAEVDPKTMKSKIIDNLYFAGEILDLDGPTGGYNLQMCWSTGYTAGKNI